MDTDIYLAIVGFVSALVEKGKGFEARLAEGISPALLSDNLSLLGGELKEKGLNQNASLLTFLRGGTEVRIKIPKGEPHHPRGLPGIGKNVVTPLNKSYSTSEHGRYGTVIGYKDKMAIVLIGLRNAKLIRGMFPMDALTVYDKDDGHQIGHPMGSGLVVTRRTGGGNYHLNGQGISQSYLDDYVTKYAEKLKAEVEKKTKCDEIQAKLPMPLDEFQKDYMEEYASLLNNSIIAIEVEEGVPAGPLLDDIENGRVVAKDGKLMLYGVHPIGDMPTIMVNAGDAFVLSITPTKDISEDTVTEYVHGESPNPMGEDEEEEDGPEDGHEEGDEAPDDDGDDDSGDDDDEDEEEDDEDKE